MFNLMKCEFFKLSKSLGFRIIIISMIIAGVVVAILGTYTAEEFRQMDMTSRLFGINTFIASWLDSATVMLSGSILAGIFICSDFESRTIQGAISAGCSRAKVLLSKAIVYFIAMAVVSIFYPIISTIGMSISFGFGLEITVSVMIKLLIMTLSMIVINTNLLSVCVFLSFVFKKSGIVVGLGCVALVVVGNLLMTAGSISPILNTIMLHTPFGLSQLVLTMTASNADIIKAVILALGYTVMFLSITYVFFRKAELK